MLADQFRAAVAGARNSAALDAYARQLWAVHGEGHLSDADAEAISHKLMVRAGLVRQLASGLYSFLPFGLRSLDRITTIIRDEMNRIGAQEFQLPVMHPAEIWEATGRYGLDEQFRLEDRGGRAMVLGMTLSLIHI